MCCHSSKMRGLSIVKIINFYYHSFSFSISWHKIYHYSSWCILPQLKDVMLVWMSFCHCQQLLYRIEIMQLSTLIQQAQSLTSYSFHNTSCCVKPRIILLEEYSSSVHIKMITYWEENHFHWFTLSSILMTSSRPLIIKQIHTIMDPPPCYTIPCTCTYKFDSLSFSSQIPHRAQPSEQTLLIKFHLRIWPSPNCLESNFDATLQNLNNPWWALK